MLFLTKTTVQILLPIIERKTYKKEECRIPSPRQPLRLEPAIGIYKNQNEKNEICSSMKRVLVAGYVLKVVLAAVMFHCLNGIP